MTIRNLALITALCCLTASLAGAQTKTLIVRPKTGVLAGRTAYTNSFAVIIGINSYPRLPKDTQLHFAAKDAEDMRDVLIRSYGFPAENVTLLRDGQATRANIEAALAALANDAVKPDDRVLVYFSGHGQTVTLQDGSKMGFLIPSDANVDLANPKNRGGYLATCLRMDSIWSYLAASAAKHRLLIADSCFGGLFLTGKALKGERPSSPVVASLLARPVLQAMTAGAADEEAVEDPSLGHSDFTFKLLEELRAQAATPDTVFLASELAAALKTSVGNITGGKQTPQFGWYHGTEGDFVFVTTEPQSVPALPAAAVPNVPVPVETAAITLQSTQASLAITTDPSGAAVQVNGKAVGATPYTLTNDLGLADKQTVSIGISKPGFESQLFNVDLQRGKALATPLIALVSDAPPHGPAPVGASSRPANPQPGATWTNPIDGSELVYIPGGPFLMGDADMAVDGNARHTATVSGYWIAKHCVTVAQYVKYCAATGARMPDAPSFDPIWRQLNHPIVDVSYANAVAYCKWAGLSLPSEAQWERAARGTQGRKFAWGDEFDLSKVWASKTTVGDAGGTTAVGSYGIAEYGISDMGGNVWQWCLDWYDKDFWTSRAAEATDPVNLGSSASGVRVVRGGSWYDTDADFFRAAIRSPGPSLRVNGNGFRCAAAARD